MNGSVIFLCTAGFFAAFVDSISGGGGLISLPAFMLAGIPPHLALGTNKFCSSCASFISSIKYAKSSKVDFKLLKILIPVTFIGAVLGANTVLGIDGRYLNTIVLVFLLFVGIYSLFSKTIGIEDKFQGLNGKNISLGIVLALSLGFYDGFLGPGTGSFLIFGLISIFNFDFVRAGGNGKVLNFISNIASLLIFALNGQINYRAGVPVAVCMIIGARFGTMVALRNGAKIIKPIFITMSLAVASKMLYGIIM